MSVNAKPDRYHSITPYLVVEDAQRYIEFLQTVFAATYVECVRNAEGKIGHAEVQIGDSIIMVGSKCQDSQTNSTMLYLYVEDTDSIYNKAIEAGATSLMEPKDQFYGDRNALIEDFSGNKWCIATHVEDLSKEALDQRAKAYYQSQT